jgi:uncharacterized membrane protein YhaH (DUF805 family)
MFLFSTDGRINRAKYWLALALYLALGFMVTLAGVGIITGPPSDLSAVVLYVGGGLAFLSLHFSLVVVTIKRLHDRARTGWWVIAFIILPFLLLGASTGIVTPQTGLGLRVVAAVLSLWGLVELGCLPGTRGPNKFGNDPLAHPES